MATIIVGLADAKVSRAPATITTLGLGSCIGLTLYDPITKIGGMVHIMLPSSDGSPSAVKAKFADTGIIELLDMLLKLGASKPRLQAKMAGGANMFASISKRNVLMVGQRNTVMSKGVLMQQRIPLIAEDTGGTYGRTIELDVDTGRLFIKTIGHGEKYV